LSSRFEQSLVARRLESLQVRAQTCVEISPRNQQHMAVLVCLYDTDYSFYLHVGAYEQGRRVVAVLELDGGRLQTVDTATLTSAERPVHLRAELDHRVLRFSYSEDGAEFTAIGGALDATRLSDEYRDKDGFTGAFVGICAHDLERQARWAHFDYFDYEELGE
jgi:xylan 1,4-beta-xylosidase